MASIADVFFKALLEDKQLQIDAVKAGDKAGQTLGERMGHGVGLAMKAGLGLVAAGAALATKGMVELDDITAQFTADTGASADEAARARKAINEMAGRNLQPMREVGAALTKVHTDLGLTGDAAEKTTERFLKFATVTKRDASEEVAAFDDILDAWGLTADKADGIMDKLIVSHQKFGGSIAADETALKSLAPAMKALNFSIDDTIALFDLFKTRGLDAADTQRAFNSAVGKLPKGTDLKGFINQLAAIEDPAKRAAEATRIFGSRGGVALANALGPGIGSLDDFRISTEDATGATNKAADAIESTFGNKAQLMLKGFVSKLIEIGDQFGPIATGFAALASLGGALGLDRVFGRIVRAFGNAGKEAGEAFVDAAGTATGAAGTVIGNIIAKALDPTEALLGNPLRAAATKAGALWAATFAAATRLASAIGDLFLAIPGVSRLVAAVVASGRTIGTIFAGAIVAAVPLILIGGIVDAFNEGKEQYKATGEQIGVDVANAIAQGNLVELKRARARIAAALTEALTPKVGGFDPFAAFRTLGAAGDIDKLQAELDRVDKFIADYQGDHPVTIEVRPKLGPPIPPAVIAQQAAGVRQQFLVAGQLAAAAFLSAWDNLPIGQKIVGMSHDVRQAAANLTLSVAAGLRSGRTAIDSAIDQLREDMKNRLSPRKEVALRIGQLFSKTLAKGLHDADPVIRKQAEGTRALIEDQLIETIKAGGKAGQDIMDELERKLHSKDPKVRSQAKRTKEIIDAALKAKTAPKTPGDAIGDQLNSDLSDHGTQLGRTAYNLGRTIYRNLFAGVEGTGYVPPSTTPTGSGGKRRQSGGPVTEGQPYIVGEAGPELFVPDMSGRVVANPITHAMTAATTINVGPVSVDARGATNPHAVGQAVADAIANTLRTQTARLPVGTRA